MAINRDASLEQAIPDVSVCCDRHTMFAPSACPWFMKRSAWMRTRRSAARVSQANVSDRLKKKN
jgi:hypothetical protein